MDKKSNKIVPASQRNEYFQIIHIDDVLILVFETKKKTAYTVMAEE